jgi:hypothetical protein
MSDAEWYEGFRKVPGVAYPGHPDIDRRKLPQHNVKPEIETFDVGGEKHTSVMWQTRDGYSSQSPAAAWSSVDDPRVAEPEDVLRSMYEALELPGTVSDYHFKLLNACAALWSRRKRRPEVLPELEKILLLDISLVGLHGHSLMFEHEDGRVMPGVPAFDQLISLYEGDGFIHEAIAIAKLATAAGQGSSDEERLAERLVELEAEDNA